MSTTKLTDRPPEEKENKGIQEIIRLTRLADKGDKTAMGALRKELNAMPYMWEAGNLATRAQDALVKVIFGGSEVFKDVLHKKLADLKNDLMGPESTQLEQLLVERILVCWLQVYHADLIDTQNMQKVDSSGYLQDRLDRAHRRYLSAIRTLAQVRRLLMPPVQVNIGAQQVNAAQIKT